MAVLSARLEKGEDIKGDTIKNVVEFMRTLGDKGHHGKEETHLFPLLGKKGVPMTGCPTYWGQRQVFIMTVNRNWSLSLVSPCP